MWVNCSIKESTENLRIAQKGHEDNTYFWRVEESQSKWSPKWVGDVARDMTMWRTPMYRNGKVFPSWGSEGWQTLGVWVWILTECVENMHHSFLLWPNVYILKTAPLQILLLPRLAKYASIQPYAVTPHPCSTVHNEHFELLGCCGFSMWEPRCSDPSFPVSMFLFSIYLPFLHFHPQGIRV